MIGDFVPLDAESRRIALDAAQLYEDYRHAASDLRSLRGGMCWKTANGREYLFRSRNRGGYGKSLGRRNPETEAVYDNFHARKRVLQDRVESLRVRIARQARFCIAAGINRVPKTAADVVRVLDDNSLMGRNLVVLGTHALYAYESASGVQLPGGLTATGDIDLLFDAGAKLKLGSVDPTVGLLGLLRQAHRSFDARDGDYRAVDKHGFRVELVQPISLQRHPSRPSTTTRFRPAEIEGLEWLRAVPKFTATVIGEDGMPVRFIAPDPRAFAVHKLWMSERPEREAIKRTRDALQGQAVAHLAKDYLMLPFDDELLRSFPATVRTAALKAIDSSGVRADDTLGLPPGFGA